MSELTRLATANKAAWLEGLDARGRLIGCLLFAVTCVSVHSLIALWMACTASVVLLVFARLPRAAVLKRVLPFEVFILILVLFIPFSVAGEPIGKLLGVLDYSEQGLLRAQQVFLRANAILLCSLTLLATVLPETIGHAMARLGFPQKLVHLFLMTVRYVSVLAQEYQRLRTAMRARAFTPASNLHTWRSYGWLMGMMLVRSLERSDRVLQAMKCRGYDGRFPVIDKQHWRKQDSLFLCTVLLLCGTLLTINFTDITL